MRKAYGKLEKNGRHFVFMIFYQYLKNYEVFEKNSKDLFCLKFKNTFVKIYYQYNNLKILSQKKSKVNQK